MTLPTPLRITDTEVALSPAEWAKIVALAEDYGDIAAVAKVRSEDTDPPIPLAVVEDEFDGVHPVAAWRKHRGLTQAALAERAGITRGSLAAIESRRRPGSVRTMVRLSRALGVPVDYLLGEE